MKHVTIYTDGACQGNPGPGGYGTIVDQDGVRTEHAKGYRLTTNNRMEIMAAIVGLQQLSEPSTVTLISDSRYVVDSMSLKWVEKWKKAGWQRAGSPVPNADLWPVLMDLCARHTVTFRWVRGHTGHPENERCDQLSVQAARHPTEVDQGYLDYLESLKHPTGAPQQPPDQPNQSTLF